MRLHLRLLFNFWLFMALVGFLTVSAEEIILLSNSIQNVTALVENQALKMNIRTGPVSYYEWMKFNLSVGGCTAKIEAYVYAQHQVQYIIEVARERGDIIDPSNIVANSTSIEFSSVSKSVSLPCNVDFEQTDRNGNYTVELSLGGDVPSNFVLSTSSAMVYTPDMDSSTDVPSTPPATTCESDIGSSADMPSTSPATIHESHISALKIGFIVAGVVCVLMISAVIVFIVICCCRRRKKKLAQAEEVKDSPEPGNPCTPARTSAPSATSGKSLSKKQKDKPHATEAKDAKGASRRSANPVDDEPLSSLRSEQLFNEIPTQSVPLTPTTNTLDKAQKSMKTTSGLYKKSEFL